MLPKLLEIGTKVSTPLMLGGIIAILFFWIVKMMLDRGRYTRLSNRDSFRFMSKILTSFLIFAIVALVLGFAGFIIPILFPTLSSKQPPTLAERRQAARRFVELHLFSDSLKSIEVLEFDPDELGATNKMIRLSSTNEVSSGESGQVMKAFSEMMFENIAVVLEREVPYETIREVLEFDESPVGKRFIEGYKRVTQRFGEEDTNIWKYASEAEEKVATGQATDEDLLKMMQPNIPPCMKDLLLASGSFAVGITTNLEIASLKGSGVEALANRSAFVVKNRMVERFAKLFEEEFSLDEIRLLTRFYEEHPAVAQLMAKLPQIMARAATQPDSLGAEKFRRQGRLPSKK